MDSRRWEHGSDLHLSRETGGLEAPWTAGGATLWGSGRDALRALQRFGRKEEGWRRVLVPNFFCGEVVSALARELPVAFYGDAPDGPLPARVDAERGDVLLVVNTFGGRDPSRVQTGAVVVEDHTHDPLSPWAFGTRADYAVASLRKTLPLPDGGVLWSPTGAPLPPEAVPTLAHRRAAGDRLLAMALKRAYLAGGSVEKGAFRARAVAGERAIGRGEISGITAASRARLPTLPGARWRERRARNLGAFRAALGPLPGVRLLDAPFAATLLFDDPILRERVRSALLAASVYPAVLWPLEAGEGAALPRDHVHLSRRLLSLHCDYRYDVDDMERVARMVRAASAAAPRRISAGRGERSLRNPKDRPRGRGRRRGPRRRRGPSPRGASGSCGDRSRTPP